MHVRDRIFKLSLIHASVIYFSEFTEFNESCALFRKNSIVLLISGNRVIKFEDFTWQLICSSSSKIEMEIRSLMQNHSMTKPCTKTAKQSRVAVNNITGGYEFTKDAQHWIKTILRLVYFLKIIILLFVYFWNVLCLWEAIWWLIMYTQIQLIQRGTDLILSCRIIMETVL